MPLSLDAKSQIFKSIFFFQMIFVVWCGKKEHGYPIRDLLCSEARVIAINSDDFRSSRPWNSAVCYQLFQWFWNASFLLWGKLSKPVFLPFHNTPFPFLMFLFDSLWPANGTESNIKLWRYKASIIQKRRLWRQMYVEEKKATSRHFNQFQ